MLSLFLHLQQRAETEGGRRPRSCSPQQQRLHAPSAQQPANAGQEKSTTFVKSAKAKLQGMTSAGINSPGKMRFLNRPNEKAVVFPYAVEEIEILNGTTSSRTATTAQELPAVKEQPRGPATPRRPHFPHSGRPALPPPHTAMARRSTAARSARPPPALPSVPARRGAAHSAAHEHAHSQLCI